MILTQRGRDDIVDKLRGRGFNDTDFYVASVDPTDLPVHLSAADVALSFIKACYSKQSSSPTKIAEYLACGLPIVANKGVGDVDHLIEENNVGVLIEDFSTQAYHDAIEAVGRLPEESEHYRKTARIEFELEGVGGERYRNLYRRMLARHQP